MDGFMILGIVLLAAGFLFVGIETDYINHQYLIGVSSGIALILCIIRSYMPK